MIYKIFKDVTNIKRRRKRPYFLAAYLLQTFLNTGSIDETFKQSYFKHILRGSANVYESSDQKLWNTMAGIYSEPDPIAESRVVMTFSTIAELRRHYAISVWF